MLVVYDDDEKKIQKLGLSGEMYLLYKCMG